MKVSQCGTFQELLKFIQVQSQKPSSAMMKLALMRTTTGKEDPELPLLQKISSLELSASEITAQIQSGKKVFSQPPIVKVLPLKKIRETCNFHHRYTSTMTDKIRKKIQKFTL